MTLIQDEELEGKSLNERYKYLNVRVKNEKSSEILSNLPENPTPIQKVFVTLVARNQENSAVLIEQLKNSDITIAMQALKSKWFFQGKNIPDVDFFMDEVFPFVSFQVMSKMVTQFGVYLKNESLAEEFYSKVTSVYGYKHGIKFLPRCSEDFIHDAIIVHKIFLDDALLLKIYKKYPQQAIKYLELVIEDHLHGSKIAKTQHDNVITLIAYDHPDVFIKLANKLFKFTSIKIGYRTSLKILQSYQDAVVKEFSNFSKILNTEAIIDNLKNEKLDNAILQLMPEKSNLFKYNQISKYLKKSKPNYRATYVCKIYLLKYKESIFNHPSFKDWPVLEELPKDERIKYVEEILSNPQKPMDDLFYWKFYDTKQGIALYKDELRSASTCEKRTDILRNMVICCKINNDTQMLLNIIQFVSERYKNDLEQLKMQFLNEIHDSFSTRTLSKAHWDVINEIIAVIYLNKDIRYSQYFYFLSTLYEEEIFYMLDNGLDIGPKIDQLIEFDKDVFSLSLKDKKYARIIFDICLQKYKNLIDKDSDIISKIGKINSVLNGFTSYNSKYVEKLCITHYDWLISVIDEMFEKANFESRFLTNNLEKHLDTKKKYTSEIFKYNSDPEYFVKNLLIHNSEFLIENIDKFTDNVAASYTIHEYMKIFNRIRTYFSCSLANLLIKNIDNKVKTNDITPEKSCRLITAISNLLNENDSNMRLMKYIPKTTKIDLKSVDRLEYKQIEEICANLKKINPPASQELLISFAKEDYLKLVLPSLLSLAFKYPNIEAQSLIAHLSKQPVSVKKHGIRLAYHICPPKTLPMFYKRMWDLEKNSSIKEVIFARTFNLLIGKESDEVHSITWSVLKQFIQDIDIKLVNLCSYLARPTDIESKIMSEYCEISWQILQKMPKTNQIVKTISDLTNQLTLVSEHLDEKFCSDLFTEYLTDFTESKNYDLQPFIINYIMNSASIEKLQQRITDICKNFELFIKKNWNVKTQDMNYPSRVKVKKFVNECCRYAILNNLKIDPKNMFITVCDMLVKTLPKGASFSMIMNIQITLEFYTALQSDNLLMTPKMKILQNFETIERLLINFGCGIGKLWNKTRAEYGQFVLPVFIECIEIFVSNFTQPDFIKISICKGLLKDQQCDQTCLIIALELVPRDFEKYSTIVEDIVNRGEMPVKILCDRKFTLPSTIYILH